MFDYIKKNAISAMSDKNIRDWGFSITIRSEISTANNRVYDYREKFLVFKPRKSIILESHVNHSEVWMADDNMEYILEDERGKLNRHIAKKFDRVFVAKGRKHKIMNPNKTELNVFEIQTGCIKDNDKMQYAEEDKYV